MSETMLGSTITMYVGRILQKKYSDIMFQVERDDNDDGSDVLSLSRTSCPLGLPIVELRKRSAELSEFDQVKNLT